MRNLLKLGLLALCVSACSSKTKVNPEQLCAYGNRACNLADGVCLADAELATKDVCLKRGEVCGPLRITCDALDVEEAE
jgi:hypothetical protein